MIRIIFLFAILIRTTESPFLASLSIQQLSNMSQLLRRSFFMDSRSIHSDMALLLKP
nr:MAG TPA: hypothetical protein [Caudoviricetes sp.]